MKVAVMELRLYAPWVHSLKEKRMVVKSLLGKIRSRYAVSAAETEEQDIHQTIVIGVAAIVAHVPMESGKNGASFSAILYDTSDSRSRLRSESGEHCGAVPEYRTAYKTIIQKIS